MPASPPMSAVETVMVTAQILHAVVCIVMREQSD